MTSEEGGYNPGHLWKLKKKTFTLQQRTSHNHERWKWKTANN